MSRWVLRAAGTPAAATLALLTVGAAFARPIADDYVVLGRATQGPLDGFVTWMGEWTSFYSMYLLLNVGGWLSGFVGVAVYFPLTSLLLLALAVASARVSLGLAAQAMRRPMTQPLLSTTVVVAAALGGLASYRWASSPMLFGALYWQTAWVPHLVPLLLFPLVLRGLLRLSAHGPGVRAATGWLAGLVLGGFAFAETGILVISAVGFLVALRWLRGRAAAGRGAVQVAGLVGGLLTGAAVVFALPGTAERQRLHRGIGIGAEQGAVVDVADAWRDNLSSAVQSPSWLLGITCGLLLCWFAWPRGEEPAVRDAARCTALTGAVTVLAAGVVGLGDAASYQAWWHLWPLLLLTFATGGAAGWLAAELWPAPTAVLRAGAATAAAVGLSWCVLSGLAAAKGSWQRAEVFDENLAAARAAVAAGGPVAWTSVSMGNDVVDLQPQQDHWANEGAQEWLRYDPVRLVVQLGPSPPAVVKGSTLRWLLR